MTKDSRELIGYRKLIIWHESHKLMLMVYKQTMCFPKNELFGITSQLRRASLSVPTNIVEGYSGKSRKLFYRYLDIAFRSITEVEYLLEACRDLEYLNNDEYNLIEQQRGKTAALIRKFINNL